MKKCLYFVVLIFLGQIATAQAVKTDSVKLYNSQGVDEEDGPFDEPFAPIGPEGSDSIAAVKSVDVQAKFVGGDQGFISFVADNFQYPARCQDEGITGYVMLRFVVDTKGRISQISAIEETKSCPEFTVEAIRVMKLSPSWIPAQVNGKFVKSYRLLPIKLALE